MSDLKVVQDQSVDEFDEIDSYLRLVRPYFLASASFMVGFGVAAVWFLILWTFK